MRSQALAFASLLSISVLLTGSIDGLAPIDVSVPSLEPRLAEPHADGFPVGVPTLEALALDLDTGLSDGVVCIPAGQARHQLVFAYPAGALDRSAALAPLMVKHFEAMAAIVYAEGLLGLQSVRFPVACVNEVPSVAVVALPTPASSDSFGTIRTNLIGAGYSDTNTKYIVWYDDPVSCGCSGQGEVWGDDRQSAANANNQGRMYGITYIQNGLGAEVLGYAYHTMLHEASHTMGAVQDSAPHSNGDGHCNDGLDVMCYYDPAAPRNDYRTNACPASPVSADVGLEKFVARYDCNGDDYFHPNPQNPSYLCSHWNIGSTANRFLRFDVPVSPPGPVGEGCT